MIFLSFVSCDSYTLLNLEHIFLSHNFWLSVCLKAVPTLHSHMTFADFRIKSREFYRFANSIQGLSRSFHSPLISPPLDLQLYTLSK